jgi:hypothetical protein
MRRSLLTALLTLPVFLAFPAFSQPVPLPITGNLGQITGQPSAYSTYNLTLINCSGGVPRIVGYSTIVPTSYQFVADTNGNINSTVWPNDLIDCASTTGATQWSVTIVANDIPIGTIQCFQVVSTQGAWNINTQQAIACGGTPPNPQDATYENLVVLNNLQTANEQVTGLLSAGTFGPTVNKVAQVAAYAGATADAKAATACAALPSTGGTLDFRSLGATTQTLAGAIQCGSASEPITMLFDQGTIYVPANATTPCLQLKPRNIVGGLTCNVTSVSGFSAGAIQATGTTFGNAAVQQTLVRDATLTGGTTGSGLLVQSDDTNFVSWITFEDTSIYGFANGEYLHPTGSASGTWVTNVVSHNVNAYNSGIGFNFVADKGNLEGNLISQSSCQAGSSTSYCLQMLNNGGGVYEGNQFEEVNLWDSTTAFNIGAGVTNTWFRGRFDGTCSGNCGGNPGDSAYNTVINERVAGYGVAYTIGSYGGLWINAHSGYGVRISSEDLSSSWNLYPDSSGNFHLDGNGIGPAATFVPTGPGTVKAGSGSGTFWGADLYDGTGAIIAIPTAYSTGLQVAQANASGVPVKTGNVALASSDLSDAATLPRYCGTATFTASTTSSSVTCAWVVSGSHCSATWVASGLTGGALGFSTFAGSVSLQAAVTNSGSAAVYCSVD